MSTSLLVQKMQKEAASRGEEVAIEARPMNEAMDHISEADVILLGPLIGYAKGDFEKAVEGRIPVAVIPMVDYGPHERSQDSRRTSRRCSASREHPTAERRGLMDEEMEMICFQIISCVGTAKSCYVNSIAKAEEGDFEAAEELIKQGDEAYAAGHDVHMQLLTSEANGGRKGTPLLLLHAEGPDGERRDLQAHGAELRRHLS